VKVLGDMCASMGGDGEESKEEEHLQVDEWLGKSTGSFIAPKTRLRYKGGWHNKRGWRKTTDDHVFYYDILNPARLPLGFIATVEEPSQYPQLPTTNGIPLTPHLPNKNLILIPMKPLHPSKLTPQRSYLWAILCGNNKGN